jgi:hypothetical protein
MTHSPRRLLRGCLFLLTCLLPLVAAAHSHASSMHMQMQHGAALGASAAFDAHGQLWLVTAGDGHVWLRHSDDFGKTLSAPVSVNGIAEKIAARGENRPEVALGAKGQIYVCWTHPLAGRWTSEVRFARSLDGGRTFSAPVTVSGDASDASRGFATLAVAGNGDVVVAWIDNGVPSAPKVAGQPHRAAYEYSWSTDGGKTFALPRRLMDHSCECCRIALARAPDGAIATFFRGVYGDNIRDHAVAWLRTDGKSDDVARATFSGWQIAACPEQGPGLAVGTNGVRHGVWYEASHGPAIWYGQLDPGHPPRHKLKIGGPGAGHADVTVSGDDVWVVWNQVDAQGYRLMLRSSRDAGDHFGAARTIATSTDAVYSPQLLVHQGRAYVAWNTAAGFRLIATHPARKAKP